ncbi:MAG: CinA family protein [Mobilicoccus sp.]|nr:CinA family protein [Mobilicoccus sp.]
MPDAAALLTRLRDRGETLAVAESLTGGLVLAALTDVPGASDVVRGGVVAYATDLKASLLGVDTDLLADGGPVQVDVAWQMATGVARALGATWGLATTGVAGPGPADGHPAGTVCVGVHSPRETVARLVPGLVGSSMSRSEIRAASVTEVLALALSVTD